MNTFDKSVALSQSILGAELDAGELDALAGAMGIATTRKGDYLVREGEPRRTLFVLADGRLSVCTQGDGGEQAIYQLRVGEVAGTRAFLDSSARKAGLRAEIDSTVLTLEPEAFEGLVNSHPWVIYKVMRALFRVTHANLMRMNLESAELRNYMMKTGGRY